MTLDIANENLGSDRGQVLAYNVAPRALAPEEGPARQRLGRGRGPTRPVFAHRRRLPSRNAILERDGADLVIEWRQSDDQVIVARSFELEFEGVLP